MAFGFGRIEFDGNIIELSRPWTSFQSSKMSKRTVQQASSGIEETLPFFSQWFVNARLSLLNPQENQEFRRLFEYAEAGGSFTLIRDRNLGTYIPFEGGINPTAAPRGLKTIDDVDGTFTRALTTDSAWYLDEGTGLMTVRNVVNQPRFPEGKFGAGIQIDGAAAQLIAEPSGPFDTGGANKWTATSITASADTSETLDPSGANTADKLLTTSAAGSVAYQSGTAKGNDVTFAVWLKCSTGTVSVNLIISGDVAGTANTNITVTTEWQRFQFTTDTSGFTGNIDPSLQIVPDATVVYIWSANMYDSAEFDLGTVGALSTAAVTRAAEKLTYASANIVNRDKGTVAMWINPRHSETDPGAYVFFESGDSAGADADLHLQFFRIAAAFGLIVRANNADNKIIDFTASDSLTQNNDHHIACTWDSTIANGGKIYQDGVLLDTSSNNPFNVSEVGDTLAIGMKLADTLPSYTKYDEILITKNVLTAREIADIHAMGIGLGIKRNRFTVTFADPDFASRWLSSDIYDLNMALKEVLT